MKSRLSLIKINTHAVMLVRWPSHSFVEHHVSCHIHGCIIIHMGPWWYVWPKLIRILRAVDNKTMARGHLNSMVSNFVECDHGKWGWRLSAIKCIGVCNILKHAHGVPWAQEELWVSICPTHDLLKFSVKVGRLNCQETRITYVQNLN